MAEPVASTSQLSAQPTATWQIDRIDSHRVEVTTLQYRVHWRGQPRPTWESVESFSSYNSAAAIDDYWADLLQQQEAGTDLDASYEVGRVLTHFGSSSAKEATKYLVRWKGYGSEWDSWVIKRHLGNAKGVLSDYYRRLASVQMTCAGPPPPRLRKLPLERSSSTIQPARRRKRSDDTPDLHQPAARKRTRETSVREMSLHLLLPDESKSQGDAPLGNLSPLRAPLRPPTPRELSVSPGLSSHRPPSPAPSLKTPVSVDDSDATRSFSDFDLPEVDPFSFFKRLATAPPPPPPTHLPLEPMQMSRDLPPAPFRLPNDRFESTAAAASARFRARKSTKDAFASVCRVLASSEHSLLKTESDVDSDLSLLSPLFGPPPPHDPVGEEVDEVDEEKRSTTKDQARVPRRSSRISGVKGNVVASSASSTASVSRKPLLDGFDRQVDPLAANPFFPHTEQQVATSFRRDCTRTLNAFIESTEPNAPPLRIYHLDGKDLVAEASTMRQSAPLHDFEYAVDMHHSDKVDARIPMKGCGCKANCRSDDGSCACRRRQMDIVAAAQAPYSAGFAYDEDGLLRYHVGDQVSILECNESCGCPPSCQNRVVGRGRKMRLDLVLTETRGWGIYAAHDGPVIKAGSFFTTYAGELLTLNEAKRRSGKHEAGQPSYLFDLDFQSIDSVRDSPWSSDVFAKPALTGKNGGKSAQYSVDAIAYGNLSRFLNHSCLPNLYTRAVYFDDGDEARPRLTFYAFRDVFPGEELTISYKGDDCLVDFAQGKPALRPRLTRLVDEHWRCRCDSPHCTGSMFA